MATLYWMGGTGENGNNWNITDNWLMSATVNGNKVLSKATRSPIGNDMVIYSENIGSDSPTIIHGGVFGVTSGLSRMSSGTTGAHFAILSVCATGGMILHGTTYYWAGWTGNTAGTTASAYGQIGCYLQIKWGNDYAGSTYLNNNNTLLAMGLSRIPPADFSFSTKNPIRLDYATITGNNNPFNYWNANRVGQGATATLASIDRLSNIIIKSPTQKTKTTVGTTASYPSIYMVMQDHGATGLPAGFCADWKKFAHGLQKASVQLFGGYNFITIPSWNGVVDPIYTWGGSLSINGITTGDYEYDPNIGAIVDQIISLGGNPDSVTIQRGSTLGGGISIFPQIEGYNKSINTSYNIVCSCGITSNRNAGVSFSNPIIGVCGAGGSGILTYKRSVGETQSYQYYISIADVNDADTPQFGTPYFNIQEIDVANTYNPTGLPRLIIQNNAFINDVVLEDSNLEIQQGVEYNDMVIKKGEMRGFSSIDMRTTDAVGSSYAALIGGGYTGSVGILNVSPYAKFTPNQNTTTTF